MNVLIVANCQYQKLAIQMLYSLFEQTTGAVDVYLFHRDLGQRELEAFGQLFSTWEGKSLFPVRVPEAYLERLPETGLLPAESYFRLIAPALIPEALERQLLSDGF